LALWFATRLKRSDTVRLYPSIAQKFNIGRFQMYRALQDLETASLVSVQRCRGRSPLVTLLKIGSAARKHRAKRRFKVVG
jgi:hypothetical protein